MSVGRHKHWSTNDPEEVYGDSLETVGTLRSPKLAHEKLTCIGDVILKLASIVCSLCVCGEDGTGNGPRSEILF